MSDAVVRLRNVSKSYRDEDLLRDVTVEFRRGRTYGLVGANGSGKSVLLKLICQFVRPDSGSIWISPEYLSRDRVFPDKFGVIIDGPAYQPHASGFSNLRDLAAIRRRITDDDIGAIMCEFGLDPRSRKTVRRYSLGMKQKLALAQAFMESPDVLVLDEPFNALDRDSAQQLVGRLHREKERGTTVILTSHDQSYLEDLSDEIFMIDGKTVRHMKDGATA